MARLRTRMSKIKELLRLKFDCHLPNRSISACLNIGCSTVSDVVTRFRGSQLAWPLPEGMTESQLEALLYTGRASDSHKRMPDFPLCHQELKRKGMTKILLWQEYQQEAGENAYGYSQFCNLYGEWLKQQKRSMRQHHVAGEKLFLDFCGPTIPVIKGCCYDNACAESFFHSLKVECIHGERFISREIMRTTVFNYIECDYNRWRRHSACGGLSPEQFENQNLA